MPTKEVDMITDQIDRITFEGASGEKEGKKTNKGETPEGRWFKRILVAVDGSSGAEKALEWAIHLGRGHESRVTVLLVLPQQHAVQGTTLPSVNPRSAKLWGELIEQEEKAAKEILAAAVSACKEAGLRVEKRLERGPVVKMITSVAQEEGSDLVIVGSHGRRGLQRFMLGSVAEGVRDHVPCSILIARARPPAKQILLGVDGSEPSRHAGRAVTGIMKASPSHVHVVHVVHAPVEGLEPEMREKWYRAAQDLREPLMEHAQFPTGSWVHYDVHFGTPSEEMLRIAEDEETDLIVVGCRGLSGLQSLVTGSVSRRVSHHADASVLIVK